MSYTLAEYGTLPFVKSLWFVPMNTSLQTLLDYLENLEDRAPLDELMVELSKARITCEDVADFMRFSERGYTRNLVQGGQWYNLLVLCWKNGQRSPIHDHAGSTC